MLWPRVRELWGGEKGEGVDNSDWIALKGPVTAPTVKEVFIIVSPVWRHSGLNIRYEIGDMCSAAVLEISSSFTSTDSQLLY